MSRLAPDALAGMRRDLLTLITLRDARGPYP